ncbi:MAG: DUF3592 domain-containing protein [Chlamydiia bacterium]|nr:DUF3592 domain-containing protein [Chlamydiia bacterium]
MHKNPVWLSLLGAVVLITLYYVLSCGGEVLHYHRQSVTSTATVEAWRVVQGPWDRYYVEVAFRIPEAPSPIRERWTDYPFRNEWAAQEAIAAWKTQSFTAYYSPKAPAQATLQHRFPWKPLLYCSLLLGILFYFLGLGYYVGKRKGGPQ